MNDNFIKWLVLKPTILSTRTSGLVCHLSSIVEDRVLSGYLILLYGLAIVINLNAKSVSLTVSYASN